MTDGEVQAVLQRIDENPDLLTVHSDAYAFSVPTIRKSPRETGKRPVSVLDSSDESDDEEATTEESYPCADCTQVCKSSGGLTSHRRSKHAKPTPTTPPSVNLLHLHPSLLSCPPPVMTLSPLDTHPRQVHCKFCGKEFPTARSLPGHVRTCSAATKPTAEDLGEEGRQGGSFRESEGKERGEWKSGRRVGGEGKWEGKTERGAGEKRDGEWDGRKGEQVGGYRDTFRDSGGPGREIDRRRESDGDKGPPPYPQYPPYQYPDDRHREYHGSEGHRGRGRGYGLGEGLGGAFTGEQLGGHRSSAGGESYRVGDGQGSFGRGGGRGYQFTQRDHATEPEIDPYRHNLRHDGPPSRPYGHAGATENALLRMALLQTRETASYQAQTAHNRSLNQMQDDLIDRSRGRF
jgi:hypothetical protein